MIVAGVMSGTSADGINVALVRLDESEPHKQLVRSARAPRRSHSAAPRAALHIEPGNTKLELLGHAEFPYPAVVRRQVLASMNSSSASVADLARLNFLLGELYAEAVLAAQKKLRVKVDLIGCHGQTLYHQGTPAGFLGKKLAVTWQTGEAAVTAERTRIPVVSDFRPADMAAGGKGAPLVPYLDYLLYCDPNIGRVAQNIGGIANLTAIPANASLNRIMAFDTGPGNMVMDALTEQLFSHPFDRDGRIAASGRALDRVVQGFLRGNFFGQRPPKTAGREEFGREFALEFLRACGSPRSLKSAKGGASGFRSHRKRSRSATDKRDVIATATAFTCLLYTSPSPRDLSTSRMPSSA